MKPISFTVTPSFIVSPFSTVIPAKAGIHQAQRHVITMDSRLRGNDGDLVLKDLLE